MATGYTYGIATGSIKTFREYVLHCLGAFGVDGTSPEESIQYYEEVLEGERADLKTYMSLDEAGQKAMYESEKLEEETSFDQEMKLTARYEEYRL